MALAHKIDEETFSKYGESIQGEYSKDDESGNYFLQTTGLVPKARLDEFRTNNLALKTKNEDLEKRAEILGDMTAAEFAALKTKAENAKGGTLTETEKTELVEAEVNKRITKLNETNETTVNGLKDKLSASDTKLAKVLIDNNLKTIGIKLGVEPDALEDFIARGNRIFKMVDGEPKPLDSNKEIVYGKDGQTPLSMDDWAAGLSSSAPHLFLPSGGNGNRHRKEKSGGAANTTATGKNKMAEARNS